MKTIILLDIMWFIILNLFHYIIIHIVVKICLFNKLKFILLI